VSFSSIDRSSDSAPPSFPAKIPFNHLAPSLEKKGLRLPPAFVPNRHLYPIQLERNLLLSFGLTEVQVAFFLVRNYHTKLSKRPTFFAVPKDPRLPRVPCSPSAGDPIPTEDDPIMSRFRLDAVVDISAPTSELVADYLKLIRALKKIWKLDFCRPDKALLHRPTFLRDLIVLALTVRCGWPVNDVDTQLQFMGLPLISARRPNARGVFRRYSRNRPQRVPDTKMACKEIVRATRKRIREILEAEVFVSMSRCDGVRSI
jgi:hypothetical protein